MYLHIHTLLCCVFNFADVFLVNLLLLILPSSLPYINILLHFALQKLFYLNLFV